jgi:putative ABC transport system permease protein
VGDLWSRSFVVEGAEAPQPGSEPAAAYRVATPGYFAAIGAQLAAGRDFTAADDRDAPAVIVVNQTFAATQERCAALADSLRQPDGPWREVVGVVADLQQYSWADVARRSCAPEQDRDFATAPVRTSP